MRVMMKVCIPAQTGNKGIIDGGLPATVKRFVELAEPEATYFIAENGKRTALFFFEMSDARDLPLAAEPFFLNLDADVTVTPAMNLEDMTAGVQKARQNR